MKNLFKCAFLLFGMLLSIASVAQVYTVSPTGEPYWMAAGYRIDFTGSTPTFGANVNTSHRSEASHGVVDLGTPWIEISRNANGDMMLNKLNDPNPIMIANAGNTVGGEINVVRIPNCGTGVYKFFIIYQYRQGTFFNRMAYRVYDLGAHTLSPAYLLPSSGYPGVENGIAVSRVTETLNNQDGYYLYYTDGQSLWEIRSNGLVFDQNYARKLLYSLPANARDIVELELSEDGTKLAFIARNNPNVYVLDMNTFILTSGSAGASGMYLTGLEFSPNSKQLFANRWTPSYPAASSIAKFDVADMAAGAQHTLIDPDFAHSHIEYAYDGYMYITDGYNLQRLSTTTGSPLGAPYAVTSNPNAFALDQGATYGSPVANEAYRLPDQQDGNVMSPDYSNNGYIRYWPFFGPVCGSDDQFFIPDDIALARVRLFDANTSAPVGEVYVHGNQWFDMTDNFPDLQCSNNGSQQYYFEMDASIQCSTNREQFTSPAWSIACTYEPEPVVGQCTGTNRWVTVQTPPAGYYTEWWDMNGFQHLASLDGQTQVALPPGDYYVYFMDNTGNHNCNEVADFTVQEQGCTEDPRLDILQREVEGRSVEAKPYPNPAEDVLNLPVGMEEAEVVVLDAQGRTMKLNRHAGRITTAQWPNGLYMMMITTPTGEVQQHRVMIVH